MAVVAISDSILTDIADAIRSKNGTENTYKPSQMPDAIEAISGGGITPTGTKQISITQNGTTTEDVTNYASAEIIANVPNTYSSGDEGKVVSNGALVSQISDTVTSNGTVDTTLINSLLVNVASGGGITGEKGTYEVTGTSTKAITINHSLGAKPKLFLFLCKDLTTVPASQVQVAALGVYLGSDYNVFVSSSAKKTTGVADVQVSHKTDGDFQRENISSASYGITSWTNTQIYFVTTGASRYWKQGTYDYVIVA